MKTKLVIADIDGTLVNYGKDIMPLTRQALIDLHEKGVFYLILGGVLYTIGAILYSIKKIKFNHAIFHFFVLAGSFCHFLSIYLYV